MASRRTVTLVFATTMALAGFLLFQVQPVLAKFILPWFGGSATTWIVCMLFFQVALLAGYLHAYGVTLPFSIATQTKVQIAIVVLSLLLLPITPSDLWKPDDPSNPTWRIIALLTVSVGLPYAVLATTSPLLSRWLAHIDVSIDPARFFAASNLGSFVGLLTYPFIFERLLSSPQQTMLWSIAYVVYAALFAGCAWIAWRAAGADREDINIASALLKSGADDRTGLWIFYSMLGSVLLLATTNAITQWSAVVPFLWIAPLSLYLLTFVIAFGGQRIYRRGPFVAIFLVLAAIIAWSGYPQDSIELLQQLVIQCGAVFFGCMICHAEMVRLRPEPKRLPKFYLAISVGGALGGIIVALIAPFVFRDYFEHPLVLAIIGITGLYLVLREPRPDAGAAQRSPWLRPAAIFSVVFLLVGLGGGISKEISRLDELVERVRNFYGVVKIVKEDEDEPQEYGLVMEQGGVDQGSQYQLASRKMQPLCAFDENAGIGLAIANHAKRRADPNAPLRIGIVGMGVGMIAALGREGDTIRYYEINPSVAELASKYFTFIKDGKAKVDVLLGDGRLVLERQLKDNQPQQFDILVIDAFRGASPPTHLMTKEAFDIYLKHMADNAILAINFEIDTFEMAPLHRAKARLFNLNLAWFETPLTATCQEPISWALYTRDNGLFNHERVKPKISPWRDDGKSELVWTDSSSNLMSIINFGKRTKDDE